MRYLLLEYSENPIKVFDLLNVTYCNKSNLNLLEGTLTPAISVVEVTDTNYSTKVGGEVTESDNSQNMILGTKTVTLVDLEQSDTDNCYNSISMSLITMTSTKVQLESTDEDI